MALLTKRDRVLIPGYKGLIGSTLTETLRLKGYENVILKDRDDLDLRDQGKVRDLFRKERPDVCILAAARVGGIGANSTLRADFARDNLLIQTNVLSAAHEFDVHRMIFLGSSCIYPRDAPQPLSESSLLTGPLEFTNRPYAIAKIAGLELVDALRRQHGRDYFSVMPTNLYGPRDNFDPQTSHVLAALVRRFFEAKRHGAREVTVWGSGNPLREFLYAPDCADAILFLAETLEARTLDASPAGRAGWSHVNIGSGDELSIRDLASLVARVVGFEGKIVFDSSKPDGTPRKRLDSSFLESLGWRRKTSLEEGIRRTVDWFAEHSADRGGLK